VARCLIIGCGCRGRALARGLSARGHAVRGTTRDPAHRAAIEQAGAEAIVGDPDRLATLAGALEHVSVACILLGSAAGEREQLAALHGPRLEMLLLRTIDSTVHGVLYEASGSVPEEILRRGAEIVASACEDSRIPYALLEADPAAPDAWVTAALESVERLLEGG
jgi:uncharacterized protein YbjT (DUF2867 family)